MSSSGNGHAGLPGSAFGDMTETDSLSWNHYSQVTITRPLTKTMTAVVT